MTENHFVRLEELYCTVWCTQCEANDVAGVRSYIIIVGGENSLAMKFSVVMVDKISKLINSKEIFVHIFVFCLISSMQHLCK